MKFGLFMAGAVVAMALSGTASAQVIADSTGQYGVGVGANGELYDSGSDTGFVRLINGFDPLRPGTPRDSWSVASGLGVAYADQTYFGVAGLTTSAVVTGANTASALASTIAGFDVAQSYSFAPGGNVLRIDTVVTNTSGGSLHGLFARDVDWDIAGGENTLGVFGANGSVLHSSFFGFEDPSADVPYAFGCDAGCNEVGDLGAGIQLDLGLLGAGEGASFTYFYGLNTVGGSLNDLINQGFGAGATYILGTQSADLQTSADAAILGVSGVTRIAAPGGAAPEPATWAMMLTGFFGLGGMVRRRRALAA